MFLNIKRLKIRCFYIIIPQILRTVCQKNWRAWNSYILSNIRSDIKILSSSKNI